MHKSTLSWIILCEYQGCVRAWCDYPGFPVLSKSVEAPYTESDVAGAGGKEVASFKAWTTAYRTETLLAKISKSEMVRDIKKRLE